MCHSKGNVLFRTYGWIIWIEVAVVVRLLSSSAPAAAAARSILRRKERLSLARLSVARAIAGHVLLVLVVLAVLLASPQ